MFLAFDKPLVLILKGHNLGQSYSITNSIQISDFLNQEMGHRWRYKWTKHIQFSQFKT